MDEDWQRAFKEGPFARLPFGGGELVRTADKIVKVRTLALIRRLLCCRESERNAG